VVVVVWWLWWWWCGGGGCGGGGGGGVSTYKMSPYVSIRLGQSRDQIWFYARFQSCVRNFVMYFGVVNI